MLNRLRKILEWVAWAMVALVLVHLCGLQLRPESAAHHLQAILNPPPAGSTDPEPTAFCDRMAEQASVEGGNVWLRFAGHTATNEMDKYVTSLLYFRGSYKLYPRRVYVAPADRVINHGWEILQAEFHPSLQWLQERNVRCVLTLGKDALGRELPAAEIIPARGGRTGTPTGGKEGQ
jgi:hypothetical protein